MCCVLFVACLAASAQANLISNGSFEAQPVGTTVSSGSGNFTDSTTFTGWRVNNGNAASDFFTATIVPSTDRNAGAGTNALRLAITNNTDTACYLESMVSIPASYGITYLVSFDAARISGDDGTTDGNNMWVGVFEYDINGNVLNRPGVVGGGNGFMSVTATKYTTYSYNWTPDHPNCASIRFIFYPAGTRNKMVTVDLANIQFESIKGTPNLFIATGSFNGVTPGTSVSQTIDSSTIPGWEVHNGNPSADFFSATIVPSTDRNAGAGTNALQLAITNNTDTACYLESKFQTPVSYGTKYLFYFDAAWISGGTFDNLWVGIREFDSSGDFIIRDQLLAGFLSVTSTNYATYRYSWTPTATNCVNIHFIFYPEATRTDPATFSLANIRFETVNGSLKLRRAATQ